MVATLARWTLDDYQRLRQADLLANRQLELLNGLIVELAAEGDYHDQRVAQMAGLLSEQAQGRYRVLTWQPIAMATTASQPQADILLVDPETDPSQTHPIPKTVSLVVEVADQSLAKDMDDKRYIYAAAEIKDYWVVNLRDRELLIYHQPLEGDYQVKQHLRQGTASPLAFPEVVVPVRSLF